MEGRALRSPRREQVILYLPVLADQQYTCYFRSVLYRVGYVKLRESDQVMKKIFYRHSYKIVRR